MPIEIFAQGKGKDLSNDALLKLVEIYLSKKRVGTLLKEVPSGNLIADWQKAIEESENRPELVDMSSSVSSFMAIKDSEELVRKSSFRVHKNILTHSTIRRKPLKLPRR